MMLIDGKGTIQRVVVEGDGEYLRDALTLLIGREGKCGGLTKKGGRLVLTRATTTLPAPVGVDQIAPLVLAWLQEAEYPEEPNFDGSTRRGWRVLGPGVNDVDYFALGAIEPCWMEFHK